ncbi:MAG: DUF3303 family protein [Planctomycetota bacterium]|nr:DUF3303 family protein [Planctomycetota bacterium]
MALFMVIERFRGGDPAPVYARFREKGRQAPEGLTYVSSWVDEELRTCFQVMEAPGDGEGARMLLDEWIARWEDLVEFEVIPVITSSEAAARVMSRRG